MSNDTRRAHIRRLAQDHTYRYRAYLSSALTNLVDAERDRFLGHLEELYLEVFHPLDVFLYLPHLWSAPGHASQMSAAHVHILDRLRIAESDFLVLCADYPSFGAGQEFEIAQAAGLRILLYHHEKKTVSRMILGGAGLHAGSATVKPPQTPVVVRYTTVADLKEQLTIRASEICSDLRDLHRMPVPDFSARLKAVMTRQGFTEVELASATGFTVQFIEFLLSSNLGLKRVLEEWDLPQFSVDLDITKYINPGLWVIRMLARAMEVDPSELVESEVSAAQAERREAETRLQRSAHRVARKRNISVNTWDKLQDVLKAQDAVAARSAEDLDRFCERLLDKLDQK